MSPPDAWDWSTTRSRPRDLTSLAGIARADEVAPAIHAALEAKRSTLVHALVAGPVDAARN